MAMQFAPVRSALTGRPVSGLSFDGGTEVGAPVIGASVVGEEYDVIVSEHYCAAGRHWRGRRRPEWHSVPWPPATARVKGA